MAAWFSVSIGLTATVLLMCPQAAFADPQLAGEFIIRTDYVVGGDPAPEVPATTGVNGGAELIFSGVLLVDTPFSYQFPVVGTGISHGDPDWSGLALEVAPASRAGHALFAPDWAEALVGTGEAVSDPLEELLSIRPNPSRATVVFRFALPRESNAAVSLDVFDVTGRRVARVFDGRLTDGPQEASWDGTGPGGGRVASEPYVARIEAGDFRQARKSVLLD